jgi:GNAT superfamily N-acetyltransferase
MSDPAIVIRRATPDDEKSLGPLGAKLTRLHYEFDHDRFVAPGEDIEAGYGRFLVSQMTRPENVVFVAERDGVIVGYVWGGIEPRSWKELRDTAGFVHDVFVDESARGTGTGERLVAAAAAWLVERGAPRIMLWTAEKNSIAQKVFARIGFRRTMIEMTWSGPRRR